MKNLLSVVLLASLAGTSVLPGQAIPPLRFDAPGSFPIVISNSVLQRAISSEVGDFDGDGRKDVVALYDPSNALPMVQVFFTHDATTFRASTPRAVRDQTTRVMPFDVDGDGILDLLTSPPSTSAIWHRGAGDGTFGAEQSLNLGLSGVYSYRYVPGDFNGDGQEDLLVSLDGGGYRAFISDGSLSASNYQFDVLPPGGPFNRLKVVNANDDGLDDVLLVGFFEIALLVAHNSAGAFSFTRSVVAVRQSLDSNFRDASLADLDGDGLAELVVTERISERLEFLELSIRPGSPSGFLNPSVRIPTLSEELLLEDLDADGHADIIDWSRSFRIHFGNGSLIPEAAVDIPAAHLLSNARSPVFDADGDGDLDLLLFQPAILEQVQPRDFGGARNSLNMDISIASVNVAGIAVGDFDGDSLIDLVINYRERLGLVVRMGLPDGTFGPAESLGLGTGRFSVAAVCVGVGAPPQLAVNDWSAQTLSRLRRDGTGQWTATWTRPLSITADRNLASADFNGDGWDDLLISSASPSNITGVLVANPLAPNEPYIARLSVSEISENPQAIGDFDGDGALDYAFFTISGLEVRRGRGDGTFFPLVSIPAPQNGLLRLAGAIDFDGDGDQEVAAIETFFGSPQSDLVLYEWALGGFSPRAERYDSSGIDFISSSITTDFDGDGRFELVALPLADRSLFGIIDFARDRGLSPRWQFYGVPSGVSGVAFGGVRASDSGLIISGRRGFYQVPFLGRPLPNSPRFEAPTPCGMTIPASVGVPVQFEISTYAGAPNVNDPYFLELLSGPTELTHDVQFPFSESALGPRRLIRAQFLPEQRHVGLQTIRYRLRDAYGQSIECSITIDVAECYLLLGTTPVDLQVGPGMDSLLVVPELNWPVTLESIPSFSIPNDPGLFGAEFFAQVGMFNPSMFPNDPLQLSNGLRVTIGIGAFSYGIGGSGLRLWLDAPPAVGSTIRPRFSIPGF